MKQRLKRPRKRSSIQAPSKPVEDFKTIGVTSLVPSKTAVCVHEKQVKAHFI